MTFLHDFRYALRTLAKSPGFTSIAILVLALGIGANSAMFSVIDGVLLRPLPFPNSERLVNVWETNLKRNFPRFPIAPGNFFDWKAHTSVFSTLAAWQQSTFNLASNDGEPERYLGAMASHDLFQTLRVNPILGRTFTAEEDQPGNDNVILLGYGVWKQRFGGEPSILGRTLNMDGKSRTVIGVMPETFKFPGQSTMWTPLGLDNETRARRDFHRLRAVGRLKDGVTLQQAQSEFKTIASQLEKSYPEFNKDESILAAPMLDDAVGQIRPALLVLVSAVAFVLLIACANVANLLLARAAGRQREVAIRRSLGATANRLVRQMLTESVLLSLLGAAVGLLLAQAAFQALLALAPATIPRLNQVTLDGRALLFTAIVAVLTGILFGLAPALQALQADVNGLLKDSARGIVTRSRLRDVLVISQIAAALVLLVGAGLLIRSFYAIAGVHAGFEPERVMTMRVAPALSLYRNKPGKQIQFARSIVDNVSQLPGVQSVAVSTDIPLLGNPIYIMRFEGRPPVTPSQAPLANYFAVTPRYFETMGMRLLRGRDFTDADNPNTRAVVVVNQALVDRYFSGQDPIGKRLEIAFRTPPAWREIVGVVGDVRTAGLEQDSPVQVYGAYLQEPALLGGTAPPITALARTTRNPALIGEEMKARILAVDKSQPVFAMQPMTQVVSDSLAQRRFSLILLGVFAAFALLLAAIGLYGVISYSVAQRTSELGLRMALGARPDQVLRMVQKQGLGLVAVGTVVGIVAALMLTHLMRGLVFRRKRDRSAHVHLCSTNAGCDCNECLLYSGPPRNPSRPGNRATPRVKRMWRTLLACRVHTHVDSCASMLGEPC